MLHTETASLHCPCCGERITLVVDPSEPEQRYIEDCPVCCRPIVLLVEVAGDGVVQVQGWSDSE